MSQQTLEIDILNWIADRTSDSALKSQCQNAKIKSREYTKVGYFTNFRTDETAQKATLHQADIEPQIISPEVPNTAGCVLFLSNGYIKCLEIYTFGDNFPENIQTYTLK